MMLSPTPPLPANLPDEVRSRIQAFNLRGTTRTAMGNELLDFRLSAHQVRDASALPDVPMVVLTRGKRVWPRTERGQRMEQLWAQLQDELALRVKHATHIVARSSGHFVHLDEPMLVAASVQRIVDVVRENHASVARELIASPADRRAAPGLTAVSHQLPRQ